MTWAAQELWSDSALHRKVQPHSLGNQLLTSRKGCFSAFKGFISSVLLFKKYTWVFCLHVHWVPAVPVEARRESGPLALELQNAGRCCVVRGPELESLRTSTERMQVRLEVSCTVGESALPTWLESPKKWDDLSHILLPYLVI